jgi:ankyrin repeat protein
MIIAPAITSARVSPARVVCVLLAVALLSSAATPPDPLLDAVKRNDVATVRSLLQSRKDPNTAQPDGLTALHLAAELGHIEIAKHLVDAGATVNASTPLEGYTPLHLAAGSARTEMVAFLLFARADVDAVAGASGITPLHLAAQAPNGEAAVRELIRRGAPLDAREANGRTPLMLAETAGHAAAVRELIAAGAK